MRAGAERSRLSNPEREALKARVTALVVQRPGLPLDRLCVAAGIRLLRPRDQLTPQISPLAERLLAELEAEGLIYSKLDRFAGVGDRPKFYPVGYEATKPLLFQRDFVNEVTVYHVSPDQIKQAIEAPALNPVTPKPMNTTALTTPDLPIVRSGPMESDRRLKIAAAVTATHAEKKRQIAAGILTEVQRLIELGDRFTIADVEHGAGMSNGYLKKCQPEVWQQVKDAIAAFNEKRQATEAQLKQQIEDLEERNKELRSQLSQVSTPAPIIIATPPIAWLEQERAFWKAKEEEMLQDIAEREQDLRSIRKTLKCCDRLLALHEAAEKPEIKEELQAIGSVGGAING